MKFETWLFVYFAVAVYCLWLAVRRNERAAVSLLLTASLLFYGHENWLFLPLLLLYCVIDYFVAIGIERTSRPGWLLALGVGFNLSVLCFYKYTPMLMTTFAGWPVERFEKWPLPFGISFYAFTGIAYMVDVYRRTYPAERSLVRYTLSAAFFPHLVAGPILRADEFLAYLRVGHMPTAGQAHLEAAWLIARGFFKKIALAMRVGALIDPFFTHVNDPSTAGVWALPYVWLYALQIVLDFSAYTDIARGLGLLFGYRWPDNFDWPYLASNVAEFWRRWHLTLSRFLRDYLYIPLGGSRGGQLRTCLNLMVTMLLGGLWHGASWSFLLWGGLHGAFLVLHRLWRETRLSAFLAERGGWLWKTTSVLLTFHCVCLAWCFFRLPVLSDSLACVRKWVVFESERMLSWELLDPSLPILLAAYVLMSMLVAAIDRWAKSAAFAEGFRWGLRAAVLLLAVLLSPGGTPPPFIYFQF